MKLSISLPDPMAREIKGLSRQTERPISWWLQKAWDVARTRLIREQKTSAHSHRKFLKALDSLRGVLKEDYPDTDSVTLAHQAFTLKKR